MACMSDWPCCRRAPPIGRRRLLIASAAAGVALGLSSGTATSRRWGVDPDAARAALIEFFDVMALQKPPYLGALPWWTRRWVIAPAVMIGDDAVGRLRPRLEASLARLSAWTGLDFRIVEVGSANAENAIILGMIDPPADESRRSAWDTACFTTSFGERGRLRRAVVRINAAFPDCLEHELLHALGLDNHWLASPAVGIRSIMAPRYGALRSDGFSPFDAAAVRLLYDPRLSAGTPREDALIIARRIVADWVDFI